MCLLSEGLGKSFLSGYLIRPNFASLSAKQRNKWKVNVQLHDELTELNVDERPPNSSMLTFAWPLYLHKEDFG